MPLLQWLLYAVIAVAVSIGGYEVYGGVVSSLNRTTYQEQIQTFQSNIQTVYKRRPGRYAFATLTAAIAIGNGLPPSGAVNGAVMTNPMNGGYSVVGSDVLGLNANNFGVWADNIPVADCIKLLESTGTGGGLSNGPYYGYEVSAAMGNAGTLSKVLPDTDANSLANCKAPGTDTVAILIIMNG